MYDEKSDFLHHEKEINNLLWILKEAGITLKPDIEILDIGGGQGMHAGLLTRYAQKVYCADVLEYGALYNGEFIKLLKEKYQRNGYDLSLEKIEFNQTNALELLYRDNYFDLVVSFNSFEHISDPAKALCEAIRVTKPHGAIFITLDPLWTADTGGHFIARVPEPWGHLLYSTEKYADRMKHAGASESEINEYKHAINRFRLHQYKAIFHSQVLNELAVILCCKTWSGLEDDNYKSHKNFRKCLSKGYTEEELMTRGFCCLLFKK